MNREARSAAVMNGLALQPLSVADLPAALSLLSEALPFDNWDIIGQEKLFGENGARTGYTLGAFAKDRLVGVMAQAGRFIKVLAVLPAVHRQGVGTALLQAARAQVNGTARLRFNDHPGNYVSPGIDRRYQAYGPFLLAHGFHQVAEIQNLRADLLKNPLVSQERAAALSQAAAGHGYAVRRVEPEQNAAALLAMISSHFAPVWAFEVARAIEGFGVHAAFLADGSPVAFAAHDGNNRGLGWFGPMGTLPAHRGKGLGETLLIPCLVDVVGRPDGGVIAWVGPVDFYRRACGAVADRQFVVYEEQ